VELRAFLIKSRQPPCAFSGWLRHLLHPHAHVCHPPPHKVPLLALAPSCEKGEGEAGLLKGADLKGADLKGADVGSGSFLPRVSRTMSRCGASGLESSTNSNTLSPTAVWSEYLFYDSLTVRARARVRDQCVSAIERESARA
jgi:hypothetical protein